jgi:hypothetical protein
MTGISGFFPRVLPADAADEYRRPRGFRSPGARPDYLRLLRREADRGPIGAEASFHLANQTVRGSPGFSRKEGGSDRSASIICERKCCFGPNRSSRAFWKSAGSEPELRVSLAKSSAVLAYIIRETGTGEETLDAYRRTMRSTKRCKSI